MKVYMGIDPGFSGGIAVIFPHGDGIVCSELVDMPVTGEGRERELNRREIARILRPDRYDVGGIAFLEWPSTRPGEGAERSKRFGVQLGQLETIAWAVRLPVFRVPPATWKKFLSLDGKTKDKHSVQGLKLIQQKFGLKVVEKCVGPRGGIIDGRVDALLLAYYGMLSDRKA